jgi:cell volume regulation protein A
VDELSAFGTIVLVVALGFTLAVAASKLTERFPVPAPALFLLAAAVASDLSPTLSEYVSIRDVERIGVVALIIILLDGGMHVGWRRFRRAAWPIASLGLLGTFATAAVMAVFAHTLFGFDWTLAWLLGAALAPTDPAVMFSVLGNKEIGGRSGTILEGESGVNDPVGIALVIGILEFATHDDASAWTIVTEFTVEMVVGLAVGIVGAALLVQVMRRISLPSAGLYPIRVLAMAGVIYGAASVLGGSGFLAVFVAGLMIGDIRAPHKSEIERFHTTLASLAEIAVFVTLGLTIDLTDVARGYDWLDGLVLAAILALVARPLVAGILLLPTRLRLGERLFITWGGLRGAVPILLAAFVVLAGVDDSERVYNVVFTVVLLSVLVQGTSIPFVAGRLGVRMRTVEPTPFDISVGLQAEPEGVRRFVVTPGARAAGRRISELSLGENAWITLVVHNGRAMQARGDYVLTPGDAVVVLGGDEDADALELLFEGPRR